VKDDGHIGVAIDRGWWGIGRLRETLLVDAL
jgi:hypothetical protein